MLKRFARGGAALLGAAVLAGTLLTGCGHKNPLVGTWSGTTTSPQGGWVKTRMTFAEDGKEAMAAHFALDGRTLADLASTGNYAVSGTTLTLAIDTISGKSIDRHDPTGVIKIKAGTVKPETDQFKLDGDTLTLTKPGSPVPLVLTREKS